MTEQTFHPQLRAARFLPRTVITARTLSTLRVLTKLTRSARRSDAQAEGWLRMCSEQIAGAGRPL